MRTDKWVHVLRLAFVNNGYWKLFSLVIAVLVYFLIRAEVSHVRVVSIPVEADYAAVAGGAAIESVEPRSVRVTLRGSYSEVNQVALSSLQCVVRPRQKKNKLMDTVSVKLRRTNLRGVGRVRVANIEPAVVVVKFDVPMTLPLAIARPTEKGLARGRVQFVYEQTNAVVKGSRRVLSLLDATKVQIQTEPIDVDGRSQTFSTRVRLLPPGDAVTAVVDPPEMVVNVVIVNEKATAKIERVPVVVSQPLASVNRWVTEPGWVDIELSGRSEIVKAVTLSDVTAAVNGNIPLTPSETNEVPVLVHVQQGLVLDEVKPFPATVKLIPVMPLIQNPASPPAGQ